MTLVTHISDPHFGETDPMIAEALLDELNALKPALIAISGDLTQRGRRRQFQAARAWLDRLCPPYLVVPGNHDIPLYDVIRRFAAPRERYLHYISSDLGPCYSDDTIAVVGIDTTKSFTIKHGRITREQAERTVALLAPYTNHWRIIVAHHPFDHATGADEVIPLFEAAGVDLVLSGHLHRPKLEDAANRNAHHTMIEVHAGTCMSTRLRGEPNGYNQLHMDGEHIRIVHREWKEMRFVDGAEKAYRRDSRGSERIVKETAPVAAPLRFPQPAAAR
ncbi:MAG TPA: metallophosphoesterase [Kofleriaceae bacterium]